MADYDLDHTICCIKGCSKPSTALGLCVNHWRRNRLYGSPVARRRHAGMFIGLPAEERYRLQTRKVDGCWKWRGAKDRDGYGIFDAEWKGVRYTKAHRFSYAFHLGEDPGLRQVLHRCDNPECTNPEHLFLGSNADNMADKIAKGRARVARGEESGPAILSESQARAILADPRPYAEISSEYGVATSTISSLKNRDSWRHLEVSAIKGNPNRTHRRGVSDKITPEIVREIRASKEQGKVLAQRYGISPQSVTDIRKRRSWAHVT